MTTHLTACILDFYLPITLRPMKWRTLRSFRNSPIWNVVFLATCSWIVCIGGRHRLKSVWTWFVRQTKAVPIVGDGPNTVSESTVSNTRLSELFGPRRPGRELSEFLSAYDLCAKATSLSSSQKSPSSLQNSVSSLPKQRS